MVDMSTASAAAGYSISRLLRIKPLINLAYLCSADIQLQMFGQISSKCVLTGFDIAKPLDNSRRLFCKVIVWRIFRDRRHFNGSSTGIVHLGIRRVRRHFELDINIITDTHNDNSVPCLGYSIGFKLIKVWIELIPSSSHLIQYLGERFAVIGISQATDILSQKPLRLIQFKDLNTV